MSALSWNEIRQRAIQFSREWKGVTSERAEAQSFWNGFFDIFGIKRRVVASFEEPVKTIKGSYDRIDLFWKGKLLAEHKSAGEDLSKAESQAFNYIQELVSEGRTDEVPRYIALSNFTHIALYDLEPETQQELPQWAGQPFEQIIFPLAELHRYVRHFAFFIGQVTHKFKEEDPANLKAAQLMANLHDAVAESGYTGPDCERLLVRILFCLFAEDTGIFAPSQFHDFLVNHTARDGSDLGPQLNALFDILNTPKEMRSKHIEEDLSAFPYINGAMFADHLPLAGFNRDMSTQLRTCCLFDWSRISPAIFGSLFQGILDKSERRQIGAHYTTEHNILKVIKPLFLDKLREEFESIKDDRSTRRVSRLRALQVKLSQLTFLDPACGCGNFLVIAYRELRRLELNILDELHDFKHQTTEFDLGVIAKLSLVDVNQFYGIEIGEWPARIAETALWLTDHQMNVELSMAAGNVFQRIPLRASPHIQRENALRVDWDELLPRESCSYVLGNPPFVGAKEKSVSQREDIDRVWIGTQSHRILDYVTAWYKKACDYIDGTVIRVAFVSTNSITQGEQVGVLWSALSRYRIRIFFAHRTFAWQSEARGSAHVHCVIVGFSQAIPEESMLYEYLDSKGEPSESLVGNINAYLIDGPNVLIQTRNSPLCAIAPKMTKGSEATDNGYLILSDEEQSKLLSDCPELLPYIREYIGGREFINGLKRWCFWLVDIQPSDFRSHPEIVKRLKSVEAFRSRSKKQRTLELSKLPYLFGEIRQPTNTYLLIPKVSSERRRYIPIGYLPSSIIANGSALVVPGASLYDFGVLTSMMHMSWMSHVCGRMKSDFQYSVSIVYNNFPWPIEATENQKGSVSKLAKAVLEVRTRFTSNGSTLADLYDPLTMPKDLLDAHRALDKAVDKCYRPMRFESERERVVFLFDLYQKLTAPLIPSATTKRKRRTVKKKSSTARKRHS